MKERKHIICARTLMVLVLTLALLVPALSTAVTASAAAQGAGKAYTLEENDPGVIPGSNEDSLPFKTITIDKSKTYSNKSTIVATHVCQYIQLKGNNKIINKINKTIKKIAKASFSNKSDMFSYAKSDSKEKDHDGEYYDTYTQSVTYMGDKYLSVTVATEWYAGGVSNINQYGIVFDLTTGKQVKNFTKLTKVKKLAKIKKELIKQINEQEYDPTEVNDMKATDFKFFINEDGNIVICFGPYELGWGGWTKLFEFEGNF